jgi:HlyD family secretion protein
MLVGRELAAARELWERKLMPISRLTEVERTATRIEGERGQLMAALAQSNAKVAETELQALQIDLELSSEVGKELREIDAKLGEYIERKVAAEDRLRRTEIRAPRDGVVHQSTVHTLGGVVAPGAAVMLIVPDADDLVVEAKIAPHEIDQLHLGQQAGLRFSAFNQRTTPEISGSIDRIAADVISDQRSSEMFYKVSIAIPSSEIERLGAVRLIPGMPVETFIRTSDRKVISYLMKPLSDQIARAFRER